VLVRAWPLALGVAWTATMSAPASAAEPTKKECVAANEGGQDLRQAGKLREARAALAVCMSPRCPRPVREDCAQRLADIEAALPTLVFVAKDGDGNDLRDVRVSMDGQDLATSDGNAVAVDPGDRAFTFTKDGFPPATSDVVVHEGDKNRRIQVVLGAPKPAPSETPTASSEPHVDATAGKEKTGLFSLAPATQRSIGLGVGIAGVVGLGVGAVYGILSKITYDHAFQTDCHGQAGANCSSAIVADKATYEQQADGATIAFAIGGVLTAAGVVLYLATPTGTVAVSPTVSAGGAGVGFTGRF
jgi:hypothetical protein